MQEKMFTLPVSSEMQIKAALRYHSSLPDRQRFKKYRNTLVGPEDHRALQPLWTDLGSGRHNRMCIAPSTQQGYSRKGHRSHAYRTSMHAHGLMNGRLSGIAKPGHDLHAPAEKRGCINYGTATPWGHAGPGFFVFIVLC